MNKKILIKLIFLIISISLIFSFIISQDSHHLDICEEENCHKCSIIYSAKNIINLSITIFIYVICFIINFYFSNLSKEQKIFIQKSLVFQKVQFNE